MLRLSLTLITIHYDLCVCGKQAHGSRWDRELAKFVWGVLDENLNNTLQESLRRQPVCYGIHPANSVIFFYVQDQTKFINAILTNYMCVFINHLMPLKTDKAAKLQR